jgi:TonB family protein
MKKRVAGLPINVLCWLAASCALNVPSAQGQEVTLDGVSLHISLPPDWAVGQTRFGPPMNPQVLRHKGEPAFEVSLSQSSKTPPSAAMGLPFECDFIFGALVLTKDKNQKAIGYLEQRPEYVPQDFYARVMRPVAPPEGQALFACLFLGNSTLVVTLKPVPTPTQQERVAAVLQAIAKAGKIQSSLTYAPGTVHLPLTSVFVSLSNGIWGIGKITDPAKGQMDLLVRTGGTAEMKIMPLVAKGNCSAEMKSFSQQPKPPIAAPSTWRTRFSPPYLASSWQPVAVEATIDHGVQGSELWVTTCRQLNPTTLLLASLFYGSPDIPTSDAALVSKSLDELAEAVLRGPKGDGLVYIPNSLPVTASPSKDSSLPSSQSSNPSVQMSASSLTNVPSDLNEFLGEMKTSAKAGDREKLAAIISNMRIPNAEGWFNKTFGVEESNKLAAAYEKERETEDKFLVDTLLHAVQRDGLLAPCVVPTEHVEGEPNVLGRLRSSLKEPAVFYGVAYFWKEDPNLNRVINLSFLTKIDGSYRRFPGDLVWLLTAADSKPQTGMSIDPQLLRFLKAVTSIAPPSPPVSGVIAGISGPPPSGPPPIVGVSTEFRPGGFGERSAGATKLRTSLDGQVSCQIFNKITLKTHDIPGCQPGKLVTRVQPAYPPLARQTRVQGIVTLHALIDKDGTISALEVISGHPLLMQTAMDAVKQWRYEPTLLNGQAVMVETTINVVFSLNQ